MRMSLLRVPSIFVFALLLMFVSASPGFAQTAQTASPPSVQTYATAPDNDIPGALKDWRAWVLHGSDYRACPFIATAAPKDASTYLCAWPGKLTITADDHGANVAQHWRVDAPSWVPLPGDTQNWPQDFTLNGQRVPLLAHGGAPSIWLTPGNYDLRAHITWSERPQVLPVPAATVLIDLSVDGKPIAAPQRDGNGVALGRSATTATEADSLSLQVFRLLEDGVPAELTTRIQLDVGGSAREIDLGAPLGAEFAPLALSGDLPARLDAASHLHVQLRPGHWSLNLRARALAPLAIVAAPTIAGPWPTQEVWSYFAAAGLRVTNPVSTTPIDPGQADVPSEWRTLPAFALAAGEKLTVEERSRGQAPDEANRLNLIREAWLDFSGDGISTKDHLSGTLVRDWRLDVAAPYVLRRAETQLRGNTEGLLITRGASAEKSGVEWSRAQVNLNAGMRIDRHGMSLPVNGWQQNLDSVAMTLHLPFGYRLLGAPGADAVTGSWASHWRLLDAFLVALVALFAWRLLGIVGGIAATVYLVIGYQEFGAPFWTLAAVLIFALIHRVLPAGKPQLVLRVLARVAVIAMLLVALPFVAGQVRAAIYPQLENSPEVFAGVSGGMIGNYAGLYRHRTSRTLDAKMQEQMKDAPAEPEQAEDEVDASPPPTASPPAPAAMMAKPVMNAPMKSKLETVEVTGGRIRRTDVETASPVLTIDRAKVMPRYAENTIVQSGSGEPDWHYGSTAQLHWSGPVLPQQNVQLVILSPLFTRLLRLVLVALLAWISLRLLQGVFGGDAPTASPSVRPNRGMSAVGSVMLLGLLLTPHAFAQGAPDQNILNELRNRLTEVPHCAPECAKIANATVLADGDRIRIALEAHVGERVALPVPSGAHGLVLRTITLDGVAQDALAQRDGKWWVVATRGVHRIEMEFSAAQNDKIMLNFPLAPAQIEVNAPGWVASGVSDARLLTDALELVRLHVGSDAGASSGGEQQFAPFVRLTRDISVDLDWSINNTVQRLAPASGGFSVELPLLTNETVQTAQLKVREQHITVPLNSNAASAIWQSRLARSDSFTLTAPALTERAEVWKITLNPMWHAEFSGLPETQPQAATDDYWTHEFHPLPGETLTVKVTRPEAIPGDSIALDSVGLDSNIAQHASEHSMTLNLRSTRGGEHAIDLPAGAQVLGVDKDGQTQNLRPRDNKLSLPITPGAQRFTIRWRESSELGLHNTVPAVNLHLAAANLQLVLNLPQDRWVLFVYGPTTGPAVLYWGELLLMLLLAYALTRLRRTPLAYWQWVLLGIGFSTFSWVALVVVVVWLLALQWRAERGSELNDLRFNLLQLGLIVLSIAALLCLVTAIPYGLLGEPDMQVTGNGSQAHALRWFTDFSASGDLPSAGAIALPMWAYKLAMLAWALWLANALIGWLRNGFAAYGKDGYWRAAAKSAPKPTVIPTAPIDTTGGEAGR
ncbi:hypothetical protein [Pseudolysobacter antarcticus]|uniref:hypothetical protein n=1 Tax=Pseudolysobacter antarcticus TaxID=2511995 RepID=UPI001F5CBCC2|nr:hypothetical protein [Pseudolysobacter antarcticus]